MASETSIVIDSNFSVQEPLNEKMKSLHNYVFRSMKRSHDMFLNNYEIFPEIDPKA